MSYQCKPKISIVAYNNYLTASASMHVDHYADLRHNCLCNDNVPSSGDVLPLSVGRPLRRRLPLASLTTTGAVCCAVTLA